MSILNTIQEFLDTLDTKDFYKYIGLFFGTVVLIVLFFVYRFYADIWSDRRQIALANNARIEVQSLLEKAALVKQQRNDVNAMLEQNPDFKIAGEFQTILSKLSLSNKIDSLDTITQERGDQQYNENILTAKFADMSMKELSELLNTLEQNKRIYTKSLDIQRARKSNRSVDVQLVIATLQPRT